MTRLVWRQIDSGLLICKQLANLEPDPTDQDLAAAFAKAVDAWLDCSKKLAAVRAIYQKPNSTKVDDQ